MAGQIRHPSRLAIRLWSFRRALTQINAPWRVCRNEQKHPVHEPTNKAADPRCKQGRDLFRSSYHGVLATECSFLELEQPKSQYGSGNRKKITVSKATMFMKTLGVATKCHHKKAKIRRKSDRFIGHLRQSEADLAENCGFGRSI